MAGQVTYLDHPLIQHKISRLRDKTTGTNEFRSLVEEIAMLMGYEARTWYGKRNYGTCADRKDRTYRIVS